MIPTLRKNQVVIMDNAAIHKNAEVKKLIESAGCHLLYLPPYSPHLNPIEKYWAVMKKHIKKIRHHYQDITMAIETTLLTKKKWFYS